ncbi:MAG: hypothetical protein ACU84H_16310 [Gammaproteobacteria bacterium]
MPILSIADNKPKAKLPIFLFAVVLLISAPFSDANEAYVSATVDQSGQLRILTGEGREIAPAPEEGQAGFQRAATSSDRRSVGWLALYPNCCTSYPIPLKLFVHTGDKTRSFGGNGLPFGDGLFCPPANKSPSNRKPSTAD